MKYGGCSESKTLRPTSCFGTTRLRYSGGPGQRGKDRGMGILWIGQSKMTLENRNSSGNFQIAIYALWCNGTCKTPHTVLLGGMGDKAVECSNLT